MRLRASISTDDLRRIADQPVLDVSFLQQPVTVASVELLRKKWLMH